MQITLKHLILGGEAYIFYVAPPMVSIVHKKIETKTLKKHSSKYF
jgi:hypothetical protein